MKRINLIPSEARKINAKNILRNWFYKNRFSKIILAIILFFVFMFVWQSTSILRYKLGLKSQKRNIKNLQASIKESADLFKKLSEQRQSVALQQSRLEQRLIVLKQAERSNIDWPKILVKLSDIMPQELWISKVALNDQAIIVNGSTLDNSLVSDFMKDLDNSDCFKDTTFNYTKKAKLLDSQVVDFEVITHLK